MTSRLSLARIAQAARDIDPVFLRTPQFLAEALGEALGVSLLVKVETLNPIRSFKGRGADAFVRTLGDDRTPLVCASAGNFGQGLAWAARRAGLRLDVFASESASPLKVARMRALGATVRHEGHDFDAAKAAARTWAAAHGARFVEDGLEVAVSEGAGTIGVELAAHDGPVDTLLVPLGNGALLAGIATWWRAHRPATRIVGVCAAAAPAMALSWRARRPVETASADTIADGIAVRIPVPAAVADLQDLVDDLVEVDEATIRRAMQACFEHLGLVVEPAGAVGIAACLAEPGRFAGQALATILCGGNLTAAQVREYGLVRAP